MAVKKPKAAKKPKKTSGKKSKISGVAARARKLGLQSMGYGRWGKMGRITHRTSEGKLVEVKDSKTNRVMTREGKAKAKTLLAKLGEQHTAKMVKIKMALKKAEGRDDKEAVRHLTSLLDKSKKEMEKTRERTLKLNARKKPAAKAA
jgi:hypothetical protein|uniref:Uncharacterized protein n=1 Tax=Myoviridae sp. ctshb19 TaxID=2825194 RepID=A0A8S5UH56_9CAUD|nr:MAG TPA: hypothetical protein [Myoviridae sp. ctshb19]